MIRALLFDWGDTLMRVLPEETGPIMAHWSRVEAIPSAELVLRTLRASYRIALGTNGGTAGVPLVREALARARLDEYLEEIFTAQDVGARKPDTAFFLALLGRLGVCPHEAVMVGDSLRKTSSEPREPASPQSGGTNDDASVPTLAHSTMPSSSRCRRSYSS